MDCLEFPFDSSYILRKKLSVRRQLLENKETRIHKKIAVLGGVTTSEIVKILELFLLNYGIEPEFYESEYNQFYQDVMFENEKLAAFQPDIIYLCTTAHNIENYPQVGMKAEDTEKLLTREFAKYKGLWDSIRVKYGCEIIQNTFELPRYRLLGNMDAYHPQGKVYFVNRLNAMFAEYGMGQSNLHLLDLQYLQADYGIERWSDPAYWHMYKYPCTIDAIPMWAYSLANIIKAMYGKNKKGLVLDLDNTLWGGVVGDVGAEGLEIGTETGLGQAYLAFQKYVKELKQIGIVLAVNSKNDMENALAGLEHPEGCLKKEDFLKIMANWNPKHENFAEIARAINVLPESLVFVDDNPAEREIVRGQLPGVKAPKMTDVELYPFVLDRAGFFETISLQEEDIKRNEMYLANVIREEQKAAYDTYEDYLAALEMQAVIKPFEGIYVSRISQLTNKSNQFNLTTKRCSEEDIRAYMKSDRCVTLYCKLKDRYGDNGLVSVVAGRVEAEALHIELWLMSCRVLKRDVEFAIMNELVKTCKTLGVERIYGYYYKTPKNAMVKDFYGLHGFKQVNEEQEDTTWKLSVANYRQRRTQIKVEE